MSYLKQQVERIPGRQGAKADGGRHEKPCASAWFVRIWKEAAAGADERREARG